MDIEQLKSILAKQEEHLSLKPGKFVMSSQNGPIGLPIVRALVEIAEQQHERIQKLEAAVKALSQS